MTYVPVYDTRINWKNYPDITTPLGQSNLNKMDYALYKHDESLGVLDSIKANQSDLLQSLKTLTYTPSTGVFVFTYWNGNTLTADLNVEKIPASFTLSADGIITMVNADGTSYSVDISNMIVAYAFENSSNIRFNTTVSQDGTVHVSAEIIDGSITDSKLQTNYLADITSQATISSTKSVLSESYAVGGTGTRENEDYDNAKYYKDQARAIVGAHGHTIIDSHGTVYENRMSLIFENGDIRDDATNDATRIMLGATITDAEWTQINGILA